MQMGNLLGVGPFLGAKLVGAVVCVVPVSALLVLLGTVVGRVVFELARWVGMGILVMLGVVPFGVPAVLVWHW